MEKLDEFFEYIDDMEDEFDEVERMIGAINKFEKTIQNTDVLKKGERCMLNLSTKETLEETRDKLYKRISNGDDDLTNEETVDLSQELDKYIVDYYRR